MLGKKIINTSAGGMGTESTPVSSITYDGQYSRYTTPSQGGWHQTTLGKFYYYMGGTYYVASTSGSMGSFGSWDETTDGSYMNGYARSDTNISVGRSGSTIIYKADSGNGALTEGGWTTSSFTAPGSNTFTYSFDGYFLYASDGTTIRQFTLESQHTFNNNATYVDLEIPQLQEDNNYFSFWGNGNYVVVHKYLTEGQGSMHFYGLNSPYDLSSGLSTDAGSVVYAGFAGQKIAISFNGFYMYTYGYEKLISLYLTTA